MNHLTWFRQIQECQTHKRKDQGATNWFTRLESLNLERAIDLEKERSKDNSSFEVLCPLCMIPQLMSILDGHIAYG